MISFLLLGFLIGMKHAMEADHVAAAVTPDGGDLSGASADRNNKIVPDGRPRGVLARQRFST